MKVLVLNGSPRGERGATAGALAPFVEGMRDAGADVEVVLLHKLDIKQCRGCFNCWWNTPGKCAIGDDMKDLLPRLADADIWVYATPVYVDGMTGTMKTLLDRSIPLLEGRWEVRDDHCRHPLRKGTKPGKIVLVSVSGFTEMDNFDPLVAHVRAAAKNFYRNYVGAVLRPNAWVLPEIEKRGISIEGIRSALRDAGRETVASGQISIETLDEVSREVVTRAEILKAYE
ncbi:MAG: flavodoxin family protein [Candidatus Hermodarchaeota archaeon]